MHEKLPQQKKVDEIPALLVLEDPAAVPVMFHPQKQNILKILIKGEATIIELSKAVRMNPGTVKRHLDDLLHNGFAFLVRTVVNEYGITMKYYRASASQFKISLVWPLAGT